MSNHHLHLGLGIRRIAHFELRDKGSSAAAQISRALHTK
jgi:hypothetical protein